MSCLQPAGAGRDIEARKESTLSYKICLTHLVLFRNLMGFVHVNTVVAM